MSKDVKIVVAFVVLIGLAAAVAKGELAPQKEEPKPKDDRTAVVEGNSAFALDLYAKLKEQEGNLFFSPFSISTALAMTHTGARSETAAQMEKVLHFDIGQERLHPAFKALIEDLNARQQKGGYELSVANALWGQRGYGFLMEFLDLTVDNYGAGLREVDFVGDTEGARQTINGWVEKETREKIKNLIPPGVLDALTRLVLTNAIYFKGDWAAQFDKEATHDAPFTLLDGKKVEVPMMRQTEKFGYMETEGFQALELPYVKDELSMIVLLPRKVDGLAELEKSLTAENLAKWLPELRKRRVIVELPKFKMTSQFSLAKVLRSMGMTDAFSLPPADFSGMNGKKDLFISAVIHKAYVDVNEEGTEAAAATGVVMQLTAAPTPPVLFRADHPFLFLIRDNRSGSILFLGRMINPKT